MNRLDININDVTPMMRQYLEIKNANEDTVIFFRLGDFYEMFFDDAIKVSRDLELTLTGKNAGLDEKIPMCGIPHHAASSYIDRLTELGYKVGICEQLEDAKDVKGIVKRGITQIISRGTVFDSSSLKEFENNYIGNIYPVPNGYGIAYADITTGEIKVLLTDSNHLKLVSSVVSLGLKEVIVTSSLDKAITSLLSNQYNVLVSIWDDETLIPEYKHISSEFTDIRYIKTINHLISYINQTQKRYLGHLMKANIYEASKYMKMDIHTKRNLELTETMRQKQRTYSLVWLLDKTKTAMGARLLKKYIENPETDKNIITERHQMIETLLNEFILKSDLRDLLYNVYDLERLAGRIAFGSANARDMLQLKTSLKCLPDIKMILRSLNFNKTINPLTDLYNLLDESIYEEPPVSIKEGYIIKQGYNLNLDELKKMRKGGKDFIAAFELSERERTGIKNLKVGYNKVFGYYIEISKGNISLVKDEFGYERKQTLANAERYISPILKEKEDIILNAEDKIIDLEYNLFIEVRNKATNYIKDLQEISKTISEIDVLASLAVVAEENNYIRPLIADDKVIDIDSGRHPVVEMVIDTEYVPNDIKMDEETDILLITGPNMAGKSTYMRQIAILAIMNQVGSFIPARSAKMPIFDAIYTRIGASDDLVSGESTFMVEMNEANRAISNATENSLILFDELGRGTATFDGMALAQAIIEHIHNKIKCKTIFSTHYHELTDLENNLNGLKNIHVSAYEENEKLVFLHKIKEGSVDKSYGIHVASLAHLPADLIKRASQILSVYENKEKKRDVKIQEQLVFEEKTESLVEEEILKLNLLEITPLDALNKLYELKNKLGGK